MLEICTELTGTSPQIRTLQEEIDLAARCDAKVLITGESGTGKEVTARLIHGQSARRSQGLVTINCAGIPETLLESELFGHERGSFTGAVRDRAGLLEAAHRGTAFLDEVGEMSLRMQGMLLRFLETGEIQRVGSDRRNTRVDVRVITATNRDLAQSVGKNEFRLDLFYRLNVIHMHTPALRERREDILPLMTQFLEFYSRKYEVVRPTLSAEAVVALREYHWPGNVRELKNLAERLVISRPSRPITPASLPGQPSGGRTTGEGTSTPVTAKSVDHLIERMVRSGESFWSVVYEPFMARDLTRDDVRAVIRRGLTESRGSYKLLLNLFNVDGWDYKRILNFLRKHQCHVAFQPYRTVSVNPSRNIATTAERGEAADRASL